MLCSTASGNASRAKVLLALSVLTLLGKSRAGLVAGVLRGVLTISFFPSRRPGAQGLVKFGSCCPWGRCRAAIRVKLPDPMEQIWRERGVASHAAAQLSDLPTN